MNFLVPTLLLISTSLNIYNDVAFENNNHLEMEITTSQAETSQEVISLEGAEFDKKSIEALARNGNPHALYMLSRQALEDGDTSKYLLYQIRLLRTLYKESALEKIKEYSDAGNDLAQYLLANLYEKGTHLPPNIDNAIKLYELSAKQGNRMAISKIKDFAKEKYPQAQYTLGYLYENGISFDKDLRIAINHYEDAVRGNNRDAIHALIRANKKSNGNVYTALAHAYREGINVEKDEQKAFKFYTLALREGGVSWLSNQGMLYEYGIGVELDYRKAFLLYKLGAEFGGNVSQLNLARAYTHGRGTQKNYTQALKWLEKSAAQNNLDAIVDLGVAYEKGYGVEVDIAKAAEFYNKGMLREETFAMYKMASFYESGEYAEKNPQLAYNLFKKAALLGNKDALAVIEEYRLAAKNGNREAALLIKNSE